ncbi:MAG: PEP-CTERM sorting domain-containing protein [Pirellulaceae bacterium]|nr:PEP-CTERM sorting domain-containing protein [Pirellulaceae bacterium]
MKIGLSLTVGMIAYLFFTSAASAQVITRIGSGVEAMFASQSEVFSDSDPTGILWGLSAGSGLYPSGAIIPSLPASPTPSLTTAPGNAFAGGSYTASFIDNLGGSLSFTAAQATIDDSISATPAITSDVQILFPAWRVAQGPLAPGYAYNQLNFGSNYLFTFNPGLGAAVAPGIPLLLNGGTSGLTSYAQFDAVINYDWTPVTVNTAGIVGASGPTLSLGSLSYAWSVSGPGPIFLTLPSVGSLAATPAGDGVLSLTGHAWVAGDPFELNVTSNVPEPSAFALLLLASGLGLVRRRR